MQSTRMRLIESSWPMLTEQYTRNVIAIAHTRQWTHEQGPVRWEMYDSIVMQSYENISIGVCRILCNYRPLACSKNDKKDVWTLLYENFLVPTLKYGLLLLIVNE